MPKRIRSAFRYAALLPGVLLVLQFGSLLSANVGQSLWLSCQVQDQQRISSRSRLAEGFFRVSLWLNPYNASARAGQGYISLAAHRDAEALDSFLASIRSGEADPFVYSTALRLLYQRGEISRALDLLASSPPEQISVELADYIALYLREGSSANWDEVLSLRPTDLYAHYQLWERASASRDDTEEEQHRQALQRFSQSALYPRAPELAELEWAFLPTLYARRLWSSEFTARVLANLVWQKPDSAALEGTLETLGQDDPLESQWPFLLGQLYERRGQWDLAVAAYRQALRTDSAQDFVRFRLALSLVRRAETPQAAGSDLEDAYDLLIDYHRAYPQDTQALRSLISLSRRLDPSQADALQRNLEALADPRLRAAASLSRPAESLALGPNLLANPGFEAWPAGSDPDGWEPLDVSRFEYAGPALFISGSDSDALDGAHSARIDTLWLGETEGKSRPRAGLWAINPTLDKIADFALEPGAIYIATIEYKAEDAGVSLSFGGDSRVSPAGEQVFPSTAGQARVASVMLRATADVRITLLIRQTGEGALTLDNVSLHKIALVEPHGP